MSTGFVINSISLLFIILISIIYFTKERINLEENRIYSLLLISSIAGLSLNAVSFFVDINFSKHLLLRIFLIKTYYMYLIMFLTLMTAYIFYSTGIKKVNKYIKTIFFVAIFFCYALPIEIVEDAEQISVQGATVNFIYSVVLLYMVSWFIFLLVNFKKINKTKYLPMIMYTIFSIIGLIIQYAYPSVLAEPFVIAYVLVFMYHTIENPDLKLLKEMELAKQSADKANRAKSDFLSNMSHEIRTPLNAIVGLSNNIIENKKGVPKNLMDDAKDIVEASNTLLEIVGNILDISKIESGKIKIENNPYNFKKELESIYKINKVRLNGKNVDYILNISNDIPDKLLGDKLHIKEILNNIISNSIKYTNKGSIKINAKCKLNKNKCDLIIIVKDTGIGIKEKDMEKLFERFERFDIEKHTNIEGTGLGLAITKRLVEMMNGSIAVNSIYNEGSTFTIIIPQKVVELKSKEEVKIQNNNGKSKIKKGTKVLIVDDNALNLKVATKLLEDLKLNIKTCSSGYEAIDELKKNKYDLILMDIMMPDLRGDEVFLKLKKNKDFNTPVIALTADALSDAEKKYLDMGFTDYIAKPFTKSEIEEKINKIFK